MAVSANQLDDALSDRLNRARALVEALEQGNEADADRILDEIGRVRESLLFQEIGKLTRQLHDALTGFMVDSKLVDLTEKEIPNAQERLNHVITMTEKAANDTLNVMDSVLPVIHSLQTRNRQLAAQWTKFRQEKIPYEEFIALNQEISTFFGELDESLTQVQAQLTEVLMAQSFQDLTGQIIRKVIDLVQQVEASLVEMIRFSSRQEKDPILADADCKGSETSIKPQGPVIPGLEKGEAMDNQDDVDDLLSSMGF